METKFKTLHSVALFLVIVTTFSQVRNVSAQSDSIWLGTPFDIEASGDGTENPDTHQDFEFEVFVPSANTVIGYLAEIDPPLPPLGTPPEPFLLTRPAAAVTDSLTLTGPGGQVYASWCEIEDGDWGDATGLCDDLLPGVETFGDLAVSFDGPTTVNGIWQFGLTEVDVLAYAETVTITPIFYGIEGGGPPGIGDGPYQPIREDEQLEHFEGVVGDDIVTASRITARATSGDEGSSWYPDVRVYAVYAGEVRGVSQSATGYSLQIDTPAFGDETRTAIYSGLGTINVKAGDSVEAGCILGTAGPVTVPVDDPLATGISAHQITFASLVGDGIGDPEYEDWTEWESPTATTMCGDLSSSNCINNNTNFDSGLAGWGTIGSVSISNSLVTLPPGAAIYQDLILDSVPDDLYATILASNNSTSAPARFAVSLSDAEIATTIDAFINWQKHFEIGTLEPTEPSSGTDIYRFKIANTSTQGQVISIKSACLHNATQGVNTPPPKCYFDDPLLDHPEQWDIPEGSTANFQEKPQDLLHGFLADSFVNLPDTSAYFLGAATLSGNTDSAETYVLSVRGYSIADSIVNFASADAYLYMAFTNTFTGLGTSFTEETDPDITVQGNVAASFLEVYRFQFEVPADTTVTGDVQIALSGTNTHSEGINITSVCLEPTDGTWPNYNTPGGTVIGQNCELPVPPPAAIGGATAAAFGVAGALFADGEVGEALTNFATGFFNGLQIAAWGAWLGDQFRYWIQCFIAGLINGILAAIQGIAIPLFGIGTWFAALAQMLVNWLLTLARYAMALVAGFIAAMIASIWTAIIGADWFKLLYDLLSLATAVWAGIIAVITGVLNILEKLYNFILALAGIIARMWSILKASINTASTTDLGIPECASVGSESLFYGVCVIFELSDYATVKFPLILVYPLIVEGLLAYFTFMATIKRFGTVFGQAG